MKIEYKRLDYSRGLVGTNVYCFTANSVIKSDGKLVMGAGAAKVVRDFYQGIDKLFGNKINHLSKFGTCVVPWQSQMILAFQTKYDWQDKSPIELVEYSVEKLKYLAEKNFSWTFHLPCPAIGCGKQDVEDILPLLECLPDNVIVYVDK